MKLLFFAVTKHQYRYFNRLSTHLAYKSKVIFFPSLRHLSFRGLKLFKQIDTESILETKYREIEAKYSSGLHKAFYKKLLQFQAPWVVMSVYKALYAQQPDYLVLWNGKKFHQAIALAVAKALDVKSIFFENGVLPNTTTMDFKGVNASNSIPREASFYRELNHSDKALPQNLEVRIAKKEKKLFETTLPDQYIFVPFQVAYDTQIIQHSPWIGDMFEFFELIEWLSQKLNIPFVIKEHPSDRVSDYGSLHRRANSKIQFSSEKTQTLIENASLVMTINSSVAMESLLFKKRVMVLGEAFFAIEGVVKVATSKEQILEILQDIEKWQIDNRLVDNFLTYLYYDYLLPTNWRNSDEEHYQAIEKKIEDHEC